MRISLKDTKRKLHRDMMVDFATCPVGGHNYNGKVECRIKRKRIFGKDNFKSTIVCTTVGNKCSRSVECYQ